MALDVIEIDKADERAARPEGMYIAAGRWGWVTWPDEHQAGAHWQERGGKLWLMDGRRTVGYYESVCSQAQWAGVVAACAAEIEPWARVVRIIAAARHLEHRIENARYDTKTVAEAMQDLYDDTYADEAAARLHADATPAEAAQAGGAALGALIVTRLQGELRTAQMAALAAAPLDAPLPGDWEIPRIGFHAEPSALVGHLGRHLLAGWTAARDQRDPLVNWALANGFTRTAVQDITGIARTTINRIAGLADEPAASPA
jgi:hypothetical protein